ncbi:MAG: hypothetical protein IKJ51_00595 [Clostridia bacterium]|nr:hypothetical protein [Clostridia bacterium]
MSSRQIKYYGPNDMSTGWSLREAEDYFVHWDENLRDLNINTGLELYNIKKLFETGFKLEHWTDELLADFHSKCKLVPEILGRFCNSINETNLELLCKEVNWNYTDDFWSLVCDYKVYQRIGADALKKLMDGDERVVWHILNHRILVTTYGQVIAEHLVNNHRTAEELISHFLAAHEHSDKQMHFPMEFTQEMRDKVLSDFVDQDDGNINSLKLLQQAQSSKEFPISDRLKLKARRKCDTLQEKLFANSVGMSYGAQVSFKSIPDGSVESSFENNVLCIAYSREWIIENQDFPTLLNNFIHLFQYVDKEHRCAFLALKSELSVFERHLGVKGKKDYQTGIAFNVKRMSSLLQITAYQQELQQLGIRLEDLFKWFFEVYLREEFNAQGFTYSPPSEGTTYAEKCKLLAIAIDGVLKQYRLFCEDGYVDRELLEMSSGHIVFSKLPSMCENKYAYSASSDLRSEQLFLYSDQSMMSYTEKTGSEYSSLPDLLANEILIKEDFAQYQQRNLDWLISRGVIYIADDGHLLINKERAFVLKDMFNNEVICPVYYDTRLKLQVEKMVSAGDIRYENTLFSKPEQDYLNYVLNKSEFSNGLDLRNRYSHDTCSLDEETQKQDYLELLKIMVFIIIKINEEFCMNNPIQDVCE